MGLAADGLCQLLGRRWVAVIGGKGGRPGALVGGVGRAGWPEGRSENKRQENPK